MILLLILSAFIAADSMHLNKKSVNLALETSLLFEPKNAENDLTLITQFQNFLGKLARAIKPEPQNGLPFRTIDDQALTKFLKDLGNTILQLDDTRLKYLTTVLSTEVNKFNYDHGSFHNIFPNPELRMFILQTISAWEVTRTEDLKNMVNSTLLSNDKNNLTEFVAYLNQFYSENDYKKLSLMLRKITENNSNDEFELVNEMLSYLFFDRYEKLPSEVKLVMAQQTEKLYDYFLDRFKSDHLAPFKPALDLQRTIENGLYESEVSGSDREKVVDPDDSLDKTNLEFNDIASKEIVLQKDVVVNVGHGKSDEVQTRASNGTSAEVMDGRKVKTKDRSATILFFVQNEAGTQTEHLDFHDLELTTVSAKDDLFKNRSVMF